VSGEGSSTRTILAVAARNPKTPVFSLSSTAPQKIPKFSSSTVRSLPLFQTHPQSRELLSVGQLILTLTFSLIFYLRTPGEYSHPWRRSIGLVGPPRPRLVCSHLHRLILLPHFHLRFLMTVHLGVKRTWTYPIDTSCDRISCCRVHRRYLIHTIRARPRRMTYRRTDHPEGFPSIKHQISSTGRSFHSHTMSMLARSSSSAFKSLARTGIRLQSRQASTKVCTETAGRQSNF